MPFSQFKIGRERHFVFLGFEFYWSRDSQGKARRRQRPAVKTQKSTLSDNYQWIKAKAKRSLKLSEWLPLLKRKLVGYRNYFVLPDNSRSMSYIYDYVLHSL